MAAAGHHQSCKKYSSRTEKVSELDERLPSQEHSFEQVELSIDLNEAMRRMQPEYREVLCLFYLQELSTKEIAEVLGKNESTVRTQLMRAREQLRGILETE